MRAGDGVGVWARGLVVLFSRQHLAEDEKESEELAWCGRALQAGNSP